MPALGRQRHTLRNDGYRRDGRWSVNRSQDRRGVVISVDRRGKQWRTAVEVELTRKTEARVTGILRQLLASYDDVVYRALPSAAPVVERAALRWTAATGCTSARSRPREGNVILLLRREDAGSRPKR